MLEESKKIVQDYTNIWLNKDETLMAKIFAPDIQYTEFMGTVYCGLAQCLKWFKDWTKVGQVLKWEIFNVYRMKDAIIAEWYFESEYEKNTDGFNGASVITLNSAGQIQSVREYYAKPTLTYPYGRV